MHTYIDKVTLTFKQTYAHIRIVICIYTDIQVFYIHTHIGIQIYACIHVYIYIKIHICACMVTRSAPPPPGSLFPLWGGFGV